MRREERSDEETEDECSHWGWINWLGIKESHTKVYPSGGETPLKEQTTFVGILYTDHVHDFVMNKVNPKFPTASSSSVLTVLAATPVNPCGFTGWRARTVRFDRSLFLTE